MRIGTSYFVSETAAVTYYRDYYTDRLTAARAVAQKIAEGEIHIGQPVEKLGQRTFLIDNGTRWAIEKSE